MLYTNSSSSYRLNKDAVTCWSLGFLLLLKWKYLHFFKTGSRGSAPLPQDPTPATASPEKALEFLTWLC